MPNKLYVVVASSKGKDIVLSEKLSLSEATTKLNKIKQYRKSARIEVVSPDLDDQITRFDELGEEALSLIMHELTAIEEGTNDTQSLEIHLNRLFSMVCLMGYENIKNPPQAKSLGATMPTNELIAQEVAPSFSEYKFHADDSVKELLTSLKTDVFDANEFKRLLLDIEALIDCMSWAHQERIKEMQANIEALI